MNVFDVLFTLSVLAALASLLRDRPATLILAINEAITLRAIATIARYGRPSSQVFIPDSVFSEDNLRIASVVFAIGSAFTLFFSLLPSSAPRRDPALLPRVPGWLIKLLFVYFLVLAFSERTILSQSYADPERVVYSANLGGGTTFLDSIFIYEIIRRTMTGELRRLIGFGLVFLVFLGTDYLHGSTGVATGFVVVSAMLIFSPEPLVRRTWIVASLIGGLAVLAISVRVVRTTLSARDSAGISQVATSVQASNAGEVSDAQGVETLGNGTQYAAHVFECITLYEAGESRQWKSIYRPILYTFEPSFLTGPLGIQRPKEAAWELADYFIHGGGIFVLGELYWNGGYLCVVLVFFALSWLCWKSDVSIRSGFFGLMMACHIAPNLLQGTGYGFAQISRGIFNGLFALLLWKVASRLGIGQSQSARLETRPV